MNKVFVNGHALVIGVGGDLIASAGDAEGIAKILVDPGRCAFPAKQVRLLTSEAATRANILAALDDLALRADKQSSVIVYFSGHGHQFHTNMGESYFLMPFGYNVNRLAETAIRSDQFTDRLSKIRAQRLLLLLDCCHAGGLSDIKSVGISKVERLPIPPETRSLFSAGKGRFVIASSRADEVSFAGKPHSAFTLALIEAFSGVGAHKRDGYVYVADLALHAREVVPRWTSNQQHPLFDFKEADNFAVAYYAGGNLQPKGPPFDANAVQIEPRPGAWSGFNQASQTVHGSQTNIEGDVFGPVLSGSFQGPVTFGKQETVNLSGGFYQPGWSIAGDVAQAQGDVHIGGKDPNRNKRSIDQIFAQVLDHVDALPADQQDEVRPLVEAVRVQVEKMQRGDESTTAKDTLLRRLKLLRNTAGNIGDMIIAALANPQADITMVIRKIAQRAIKERK